MAKKKFNISSTLKKNSKEKEVKLAPKIPLKKTVKDPELVKTKVEEIHGKKINKEEIAVVKGNAPKVEVNIPAVEVPEEITKPKTKAAPKKAAAKKGRMVRMTIDTPEEMHLQLKIKSIQTRMSMRDYVLKLIEKDLKKG